MLVKSALRLNFIAMLVKLKVYLVSQLKVYRYVG